MMLVRILFLALLAELSQAHTTALCTSTAASEPGVLVVLVGTYHQWNEEINDYPNISKAMIRNPSGSLGLGMFGWGCELNVTNDKTVAEYGDLIRTTCHKDVYNYIGSDGKLRAYVPPDAVIQCYGMDAGKSPTPSVNFLSPLPGSAKPSCFDRTIESFYPAAIEGQTAGTFSFQWHGVNQVLQSELDPPEGAAWLPCTELVLKQNYMNIDISDGGTARCNSAPPSISGISSSELSKCVGVQSGQMCSPSCTDSSATRTGSLVCQKGAWVSDLQCTMAELCLAPRSGEITGITNGPVGLSGAGCGLESTVNSVCDFGCEWNARKTGNQRLTCNSGGTWTLSSGGSSGEPCELTLEPTLQPTKIPTESPTVTPPTTKPPTTLKPTRDPTAATPTSGPEPTPEPTHSPTTLEPTSSPTQSTSSMINALGGLSTTSATDSTAQLAADVLTDIITGAEGTEGLTAQDMLGYLQIATSVPPATLPLEEVSSVSPNAQADLLSGMAPDDAAELCDEMRPEDAAQVLALMTPAAAAAVVGAMPPASVSTVVRYLDSSTATVIYSSLSSSVLTAILETMEPAQQEQVIAQLPPRQKTDVLHELDPLPELEAAVLDQNRDNQEIADDVQTLDDRQLANVFSRTNFTVTIQVFVLIPAERGAEVLARMTAHVLAALFRMLLQLFREILRLLLERMQPATIAHAASVMPLAESSELTNELPAGPKAEVELEMMPIPPNTVASLSPGDAATQLATQTPEQQANVLSRITVQEAVNILNQMDPASGGDALAQLQNVDPTVFESVVTKFRLLYVNRFREVLRATRRAAAATIIASQAVSSQLEDLASLDPAARDELYANFFSENDVVRLTEQMSDVDTEVVLSRLRLGRQLRVVTRLSTTKVARVLVKMPISARVKLLSSMPPSAAGSILDAMAMTDLADTMDALPTQAARDVLSAGGLPESTVQELNLEPLPAEELLSEADDYVPTEEQVIEMVEAMNALTTNQLARLITRLLELLRARGIYSVDIVIVYIIRLPAQTTANALERLEERGDIVPPTLQTPASSLSVVILSELPAERAAEVVTAMPVTLARQIVENDLPPGVTSEIMNQVSAATAASILTGMDPSVTDKILSGMANSPALEDIRNQILPIELASLSDLLRPSNTCEGTCTTTSTVTRVTFQIRMRVRAALSSLSDGQIAELLSRLDGEEAANLLTILSPAQSGRVLIRTHYRIRILIVTRHLLPRTTAAILSTVAIEDATDVLRQVDPAIVVLVLATQASAPSSVPEVLLAGSPYEPAAMTAEEVVQALLAMPPAQAARVIATFTPAAASRVVLVLQAYYADDLAAIVPEMESGSIGQILSFLGSNDIEAVFDGLEQELVRGLATMNAVASDNILNDLSPALQNSVTAALLPLNTVMTAGGELPSAADIYAALASATAAQVAATLLRLPAVLASKVMAKFTTSSTAAEVYQILPPGVINTWLVAAYGDEEADLSQKTAMYMEMVLSMKKSMDVGAIVRILQDLDKVWVNLMKDHDLLPYKIDEVWSQLLPEDPEEVEALASAAAVNKMSELNHQEAANVLTYFEDSNKRNAVFEAMSAVRRFEVLSRSTSNTVASFLIHLTNSQRVAKVIDYLATLPADKASDMLVLVATRIDGGVAIVTNWLSFLPKEVSTTYRTEYLPADITWETLGETVEEWMEVVQFLPPKFLATLMTTQSPATAGRMLAGLAPEVAAEILAAIPAEHQGEIFRYVLPIKQAATILQRFDSIEDANELLESLEDPEQLVLELAGPEITPEMSDGDVVAAFSTMTASQTANRLARLAPVDQVRVVALLVGATSDFLEVLSSMPAADAGALLTQLVSSAQTADAASLVEGSDADTLAEIFENEMSPEDVRQLIAQLSIEGSYTLIVRILLRVTWELRVSILDSGDLTASQVTNIENEMYGNTNLATLASTTPSNAATTIRDLASVTTQVNVLSTLTDGRQVEVLNEMPAANLASILTAIFSADRQQVNGAAIVASLSRSKLVAALQTMNEREVQQLLLALTQEEADRVAASAFGAGANRYTGSAEVTSLENASPLEAASRLASRPAVFRAIVMIRIQLAFRGHIAAQMPPSAAAEMLRVMRPQNAADLMEAMETKPATAILNAMSAEEAASVLEEVDDEIVECLLSSRSIGGRHANRIRLILRPAHLAPEQLAILSTLSPAVAASRMASTYSVREESQIAQALSTMSPAVASEIFRRFPRGFASRLLRRMIRRYKRWHRRSLRRRTLRMRRMLRRSQRAMVRAARKRSRMIATDPSDFIAGLVANLPPTALSSIVQELPGFEAAEVVTTLQQVSDPQTEAPPAVSQRSGTQTLNEQTSGGVPSPQEVVEQMATQEPATQASTFSALSPVMQAAVLEAMPASQVVSVLEYVRTTTITYIFRYYLRITLVVRFLALMPSDSVVVVLQQLPVSLASDILATPELGPKTEELNNQLFGVENVDTILQQAATDPSGVAATLATLTSIQSANVLARMDADEAASVVAKMTATNPETAAAAISSMQPESAGKVLSSLSSSAQSTIIVELSVEDVIAILATLPKATVDILTSHLPSATQAAVEQALKPITLSGSSAAMATIIMETVPALTPTQVSQLLQELGATQVREILAALSPTQAAAVLVVLPGAVGVLTTLSATEAAEVLSSASSAQAAQIIAKAAETDHADAVALLNILRENGESATVDVVMSHLLPATVAAILSEAAPANPQQKAEYLAEAMERLVVEQASSVVATLSPADAADVLVAMEPAYAAQVISQMTSSVLAAVLAEMSAAEAATILRELEPAVAASVLASTSDSEIEQEMFGPTTPQQYSAMTSEQRKATVATLTSQQVANLVSALPLTDQASVIENVAATDPAKAAAAVVQLANVNEQTAANVMTRLLATTAGVVLSEAARSSPETVHNLIEGGLVQDDVTIAVLNKVTADNVVAILSTLPIEQADELLSSLSTTQQAAVKTILFGSKAESRPEAIESAIDTADAANNGEPDESKDDLVASVLINFVNNNDLTETQLSNILLRVSDAVRARLWAAIFRNSIAGQGLAGRLLVIFFRFHIKFAREFVLTLPLRDAATALADSSLSEADVVSVANQMPQSVMSYVLTLSPSVEDSLYGPGTSPSEVLAMTSAQRATALTSGTTEQQAANVLAALASEAPENADTSVEAAVAALRSLSPSRAAAILKLMDPNLAAEILEQMDTTAVAAIINQMGVNAAVAILERFEPEQAEAILTASNNKGKLVSTKRAERIRKRLVPEGMEPKSFAGISSTEASSRLTRWATGMTTGSKKYIRKGKVREIVRLLRSVDAETAASWLAGMPARLRARILRRMLRVTRRRFRKRRRIATRFQIRAFVQRLDVRTLATTLEFMPTNSAVEALQQLEPATADEVLQSSSLPDRIRTQVSFVFVPYTQADLDALDANARAEIISSLTEDVAVRVLERLTPSAAAAIMDTISQNFGSTATSRVRFFFIRFWYCFTVRTSSLVLGSIRQDMNDLLTYDPAWTITVLSKMGTAAAASFLESQVGSGGLTTIHVAYVLSTMPASEVDTILAQFSSPATRTSVYSQFGATASTVSTVDAKSDVDAEADFLSYTSSQGAFVLARIRSLHAGRIVVRIWRQATVTFRTKVINWMTLMHPSDIARVLQQVSAEVASQILQELPEDVAARTFAELTQEEIDTLLTTRNAGDNLLNELPADERESISNEITPFSPSELEAKDAQDAANEVAELSLDKQVEVLSAMEPAKAAKVIELMPRTTAHEILTAMDLTTAAAIMSSFTSYTTAVFIISENESSPAETAELFAKMVQNIVAWIVEYLTTSEAATILSVSEVSFADLIISQVQVDARGPLEAAMFGGMDPVAQAGNTPADIASATATLTVQQVANVLSRLDEVQGGEVLAEIFSDSPQRAFDIVSSMHVSNAAPILSTMDSEMVTSILNNVEPDQASEIMKEMGEDLLSEFAGDAALSQSAGDAISAQLEPPSEFLENPLQQQVSAMEVMDPEQAAAILSRLPVQHAANIFNRLSVRVLTRIMLRIHLARRTELFGYFATNHVQAAIINEMALSDVVEILEALPAVLADQILKNSGVEETQLKAITSQLLPVKPASMTIVPVSQAASILLFKSSRQVANILSRLEPGLAAAILAELQVLNPSFVAEVVTRIRWSFMIRIIWLMPITIVTNIFVKMPVSTAATLFLALPVGNSPSGLQDTLLAELGAKSPLVFYVNGDINVGALVASSTDRAIALLELYTVPQQSFALARTPPAAVAAILGAMPVADAVAIVATLPPAFAAAALEMLAVTNAPVAAAIVTELPVDYAGILVLEMVNADAILSHLDDQVVSAIEDAAAANNEVVNTNDQRRSLMESTLNAMVDAEQPDLDSILAVVGMFPRSEQGPVMRAMIERFMGKEPINEAAIISLVGLEVGLNLGAMGFNMNQNASGYFVMYQHTWLSGFQCTPAHCPAEQPANESSTEASRVAQIEEDRRAEALAASQTIQGFPDAVVYSLQSLSDVLTTSQKPLSQLCIDMGVMKQVLTTMDQVETSWVFLEDAPSDQAWQLMKDIGDTCIDTLAVDIHSGAVEIQTAVDFAQALQKTFVKMIQDIQYAASNACSEPSPIITKQMWMWARQLAILQVEQSTTDLFVNLEEFTLRSTKSSELSVAIVDEGFEMTVERNENFEASFVLFQFAGPKMAPCGDSGRAMEVLTPMSYIYQSPFEQAVKMSLKFKLPKGGNAEPSRRLLADPAPDKEECHMFDPAGTGSPLHCELVREGDDVTCSCTKLGTVAVVLVPDPNGQVGKLQSDDTSPGPSAGNDITALASSPFTLALAAVYALLAAGAYYKSEYTPGLSEKQQTSHQVLAATAVAHVATFGAFYAIVGLNVANLSMGIELLLGIVAALFMIPHSMTFLSLTHSLAVAASFQSSSALDHTEGSRAAWGKVTSDDDAQAKADHHTVAEFSLMKTLGLVVVTLTLAASALFCLVASNIYYVGPIGLGGLTLVCITFATVKMRSYAKHHCVQTAKFIVIAGAGHIFTSAVMAFSFYTAMATPQAFLSNLLGLIYGQAFFDLITAGALMKLLSMSQVSKKGLTQSDASDSGFVEKLDTKDRPSMMKMKMPSTPPSDATKRGSVSHPGGLAEFEDDDNMDTNKFLDAADSMLRAQSPSVKRATKPSAPERSASKKAQSLDLEEGADLDEAAAILSEADRDQRRQQEASNNAKDLQIAMLQAKLAARKRVAHDDI